MSARLLKKDAVRVAERLATDRYRGAIVFACGSIIRGEGTPTSDLDLVVVYEHLEQAYRESFLVEELPVEGLPVEAFVHDPQTLRYFFELDGKTGVPSLPDMICHGTPVPHRTEQSDYVKAKAEEFLAAGPPELSPEDSNEARYHLTAILDDLRSPRSNAERGASAAQLFFALADHYLRSHRAWSGKGKGIVRALRDYDPSLQQRYCRAFEQLFSGDASEAIDLAAEMLDATGGECFDGFRRNAPADWRAR